MTDLERVVVVAVIHPLPDRRDEAVDAVRAALPGIRDEEGCEEYAPHLADDGTIVLVEGWASRAALAAHNNGAPVGVLRSGLAGLLAAPTAVTVTTPL